MPGYGARKTARQSGDGTQSGWSGKLPAAAHRVTAECCPGQAGQRHPTNPSKTTVTPGCGAWKAARQSGDGTQSGWSGKLPAATRRVTAECCPGQAGQRTAAVDRRFQGSAPLKKTAWERAFLKKARLSSCNFFFLPIKSVKSYLALETFSTRALNS